MTELNSPEKPRVSHLENTEKGGNNPQLSLGPQFTSGEGWGTKVKRWIDKYGSTVILPIIAVLILAGGVYLYTYQKKGGFISEKATSTEILQEEQLPEEKIPAEIPGEISQKEQEKKEIKEIVGGTEKVYTEKAEKGEGITHLARKALKDYLKEHPDKKLSNEHKVYIEDYLKDRILEKRTKSKFLEIGEEISFSSDMIEEAINSSLNLTPKQLDNLKKYSALISW